MNEKEASEFAITHGGDYIEVSAKTGDKVQELFAKSVRCGREKRGLDIPDVNVGSGNIISNSQIIVKERAH